MSMTLSPEMPASSKAGWLNSVLIPVKQHVICCGVVPALAASGSGGTAAQWLETTQGQWAMGLIVPPLVTGAVMLGEQAWHKARQKKCDCAHKTLTARNFLRQTALAYAFYAAASLITGDHHHHAEHPMAKPVVKVVTP